MSITLKDEAAADKVYNLFRMQGDRAEYIGPDMSDSSSDMLILSSATPKRTSASFGNRRSTFKVIRTVTVATPDGGTESKDAKIEISVSLPVGMDPADLEELHARGYSLPDIIFEALVTTGQVQYY